MLRILNFKTFWERSEKRKLIASLDTLIIDEASMVRVDIIDAIDFSLRKNGGNAELPFGGRQVVFVGDLFQLEPIVQAKNGEAELLKGIYDGFRFYHAHVFRHLKLFTIELKEVYRQTDPLFVSLLDKIRTNSLNLKELDQLISQKVKSKKELTKLLVELNQSKLLQMLQQKV